MIYTEIEKVLREIIFRKEELEEELTESEQEIYEDWLDIKKKVEEVYE